MKRNALATEECTSPSERARSSAVKHVLLSGSMLWHCNTSSSKIDRGVYLPPKSLQKHSKPSPHPTLTLRLFPNRLLPFPFIFRAENPLISAVLCASPLLANRFFPPKPNLASFFCRLLASLLPLPLALEPEEGLKEDLGREDLVSVSRATSKRSSSLGAAGVEDLRSVVIWLTPAHLFAGGKSEKER